jgi:GNAT superfamily N-acetyltransferase
MNKSQILALYDQDQRIAVQYPDARREVTPDVVRHVSTAEAGEGVILYSRLDESNVQEVIREQVAYFESIGQDFEWKLYDHDTPPDLKERLVAHGFEVGEAEAVMVLDLADAPEILMRPVQHTVHRIAEVEKLEEVLQIERQVWGQDYTELGRYLAETITTVPECMTVYVAYIGGEPVSTGWVYFPKQSRFASLWGGSTLEGYRGRGLYTALLATRAQEAKERQRDYLTVDASPLSRPILEKQGFEMIAYAYPCKWQVRRTLDQAQQGP